MSVKSLYDVTPPPELSTADVNVNTPVLSSYTSVLVVPLGASEVTLISDNTIVSLCRSSNPLSVKSATSTGIVGLSVKSLYDVTPPSAVPPSVMPYPANVVGVFVIFDQSLAPSAPSAPAGPVSPVSPFSPAGPCKPCGPTGPAIPCSP